MTKDEALKLALDALEEINKLSVGENAICLPAEIDTAMDACRKALAEPEQEPVATIAVRWHEPVGKVAFVLEVNLPVGIHKVYTTPPQPEPVIDKSAAIRIATALGWEPKRTWVGLTDEEWEMTHWSPDFRAGAKWAEAKLRSKNT